LGLVAHGRETGIIWRKVLFMCGQDDTQKLDEAIADEIGFLEFAWFRNACRKKLTQHLTTEWEKNGVKRQRHDEYIHAAFIVDMDSTST
jgi:hypothetical protein